jgi:hypothetical protein
MPEQAATLQPQRRHPQPSQLQQQHSSSCHDDDDDSVVRFAPPLSRNCDSGRRSSTLAGPHYPDAATAAAPPPPPRRISLASEVRSFSTSASTGSVLDDTEDLPRGYYAAATGTDSTDPHYCSRRMSLSANDVIIKALAEVSSPTNHHPPQLLPHPHTINSPNSISSNNSTTTNHNKAIPPPPLPARLPCRPPSFLGDRSVSTSIRLRRQGLRPKKRNNSKNGPNGSSTANTLFDMDFAVRSIRRGSTEWHALLRPFVADLAFRSLEYRRRHENHCAISFRPYTCQAAVLFVDLCNYSGITSLIAHRGAHALSQIVHAYFSRLLHIVKRYGQYVFICVCVVFLFASSALLSLTHLNFCHFGIINQY